MRKVFGGVCIDEDKVEDSFGGKEGDLAIVQARQGATWTRVRECRRIDRRTTTPGEFGGTIISVAVGKQMMGQTTWEVASVLRLMESRGCGGVPRSIHGLGEAWNWEKRQGLKV